MLEKYKPLFPDFINIDAIMESLSTLLNNNMQERNEENFKQYEDKYSIDLHNSLVKENEVKNKIKNFLLKKNSALKLEFEATNKSFEKDNTEIKNEEINFKNFWERLINYAFYVILILLILSLFNKFDISKYTSK